MDVLARTMKSEAKCDMHYIVHCELHDSMNHLKVERFLLFRVFFLKSWFLSVFIVCLSRVCGRSDRFRDCLFVFLSFVIVSSVILLSWFLVS